MGPSFPALSSFFKLPGSFLNEVFVRTAGRWVLEKLCQELRLGEKMGVLSWKAWEPGRGQKRDPAAGWVALWQGGAKQGEVQRRMWWWLTGQVYISSHNSLPFCRLGGAGQEDFPRGKQSGRGCGGDMGFAEGLWVSSGADGAMVHQELGATGVRAFPLCCAPTHASGHLWPRLHFGMEYAGRGPAASSPPAYTPTPRTAQRPMLLPPPPYKGKKSHKPSLQRVQAQQYTLKCVSSKTVPDKTDAKINSIIFCLQRSGVLLRLSTAHREHFPPAVPTRSQQVLLAD